MKGRPEPGWTREAREKAVNVSSPINLHWSVSSSVSCFHAVEALLRKQVFVDSALAARLAAPAEKLQAALLEERVPAETFWAHLIPLSAGIGGSQELAEVVLTKTIGHAEALFRLRRFRDLLADLKSAFQAALPQAHEQIAPLIEPLRQRWTYHGPGLLGGVANWTEPGVLVDEASVVLVHPALGGGGGAHLIYNSVRLEAVGDDPLPELPEVVRLAWLLSMLNLDLPRYSEGLPSHRLAKAAALAMLPVVLTAAGELQLVGGDEKTRARALEVWLSTADGAESSASTLEEWWDAYVSMRPAWATALQALDRLLN